MSFIVVTRDGLAVTPEKDSRGRAIDYFVKREIKKLLPSKKEKREKWLSLKFESGYKCVETAIKNED